MKSDFRRQTDTIIKGLEGARPALLLQCCCGPCSSSVLEYLCAHFNVTVLFYNPNIYPAQEYEKRRYHMEVLVRRYGGQVQNAACDYEPEAFAEAARGLEGELEGGERCTRCFELRLRETARRAAAEGFDYFCTTLTVSPRKDAVRINEIGFALGREFDVKWLPSDFKKRDGYKRSTELSKEYGLYRQDYCGCKYSIK